MSREWFWLSLFVINVIGTVSHLHQGKFLLAGFIFIGAICSYMCYIDARDV